MKTQIFTPQLIRRTACGSFYECGNFTSSTKLDCCAKLWSTRKRGRNVTGSFKVAGLLFIFFIIPFFGFSQAGILDSTFSGDGIVTTFIGLHEANATSMVLQPDGKIVVAGYTVNYPGWSCAVARYQPDGSLDISFGDNGIISADSAFTHTLYSEANAVALQSDGKIILGGDIFLQSHDTILSVDFLLIRYNADGTLDSSFNNDGIAAATSANGSKGYAITLQPNGKIIIAGSTSSSASDDFGIARFNPDGFLDSSFALNGMLTTDIGDSTNDNITSVALQPDGKIIAAGWGSGPNQSFFALARYDSTGAPDSSFGTDGEVITTFDIGNGWANAITLQPDGKIVAAGTSGGNFAMVRYNPDGSLDTSFGSEGITITTISGDENATSIALQPDGKILVGGYTWTGSGYGFALVRYLANGSLDSTFSAEGMLTTNVGDGSTAYAIALQPDNKIILAGDSYDFDLSQGAFGLARYLNDRVLGLEDINDESQEIKVFSNPASDCFILQLTDLSVRIKYVQLFDISGRMLKEVRNINHSSVKIDRDGLAKGMYLINLGVQGKEFQSKIIFQ